MWKWNHPLKRICLRSAFACWGKYIPSFIQRLCSAEKMFINFVYLSYCSCWCCVCISTTFTFPSIPFYFLSFIITRNRYVFPTARTLVKAPTITVQIVRHLLENTMIKEYELWEPSYDRNIVLSFRTTIYRALL